MEESRNLYFEWLLRIVCTNHQSKRYRLLLEELFYTDFFWVLDKDVNREHDGLNLREDFARESGIFIPTDIRCKVLEMMVALSIRCERDIMANDVDDRTGEWFWDMIRNLGLMDMDNEHFSAENVRDILAGFLNRTYKKDGDGSLFYIPGCNKDLRKIEIWYQMNMYLSDFD